METQFAILATISGILLISAYAFLAFDTIDTTDNRGFDIGGNIAALTIISALLVALSGFSFASYLEASIENEATIRHMLSECLVEAQENNDPISK